MSAVDVSQGQEALKNDRKAIENLPTELQEIILQAPNSAFLPAIATAARNPVLTLRLFCRFENVFADTCARWISNFQNQELETLEAFAQVVRFAPHLSIYLEEFLRLASSPSAAADLNFPYLSNSSTQPLSALSSSELQQLLLSLYRLLNFDKFTFSKTVSPAKIQDLLSHDDRPTRYLAVRVLAILLSASDLKLEEMIVAHVGKDTAVLGIYDGSMVDYGFLSLYERRIRKQVKTWREELVRWPSRGCLVATSDMSPLVACYGSILLPRPGGMPATPSRLITTATTSANRESVANALRSQSPILVHGLSGSGKTAIINDLARELGKENTMVTLHLNEQTDAKMLVGMYTTDVKPGSFIWRPGVLTTAIREGRWVFIEDLDRAPNEVLSLILSLIEKRELFIPNRGETLRAAQGFRLIASIRTTLNIKGVESPPALHMLGARLWNRVSIKMAPQTEFREIISGLHPVLHKFLPGIVAVYECLYNLTHTTAFASSSRTTLGRPTSPRELMKWCRRLEDILIAAGSISGAEPVTEVTRDEMFMEAVDCFASSLQNVHSRKLVVETIAEEMHIPPQRAEHFLKAHTPRYEEQEKCLQIGRVRLPKKMISTRMTKSSKKARPFANTTHAKRLLEQVGVALKMAEPVLLVGETGIGKTTVIQQLADLLGYKLTAVNLSQQSEVGDLLGGFKPINVRSLAMPLKEEFDELFAATGISANKNQKYLESIGKRVAKAQWNKASKLWREAPKMFDHIIAELRAKEVKAVETSEQPIKRRKTESRLQALLALQPRWIRFSRALDQFDVQVSGGERGFAFTFVEGNIIKAVRNGEWVLLDEINLASPDTLEAIADLLQSGPGGTPSILLSETGEMERIKAHPDFRIFGAMNPATDVGKRDLPMGLRSRFTEIYVESPDRDMYDLLPVIGAYLKTSSRNDERAAHDIAQLYLDTKSMANEKRLVDGANQIPHFSLRTLTRVLSYVTEIAPCYGLRRALYEGFAMGFLTLLDRESERMLLPVIDQRLLSQDNARALLKQTPRHPDDGRQYVRFMNRSKDRQYWMLQGHEEPQEQQNYIITPFVERNLLNLVRATSTRRFPVLIQGPTSAGKTSMIEYLAKFSGNRFVRINNHEHTDLSEYLGTYISDNDGQLRFQEGLLVKALREGHWIVLDELNLAPTDVLEALNRLLDDNRELLIPETQEIVRPHENFMLFATQNPPGLYGGRKTLSRAFRNRFLELHFDDIPEDELEHILQQRCQNVAPRHCKLIVAVYKELSRLRQSNRLFEQKDSFATLRDLFRWALRDADDLQQLAVNGYMLLGERVRKAEERAVVKQIIEKAMKVTIDTKSLYSAASAPELKLYDATSNSQSVVWTQAMRRLYCLVARAIRHNEPVLLVGETGCGKTTVCQMLAEAFRKELHIVNAHQNTETGDLIGAQRPVRNRAALVKQIESDMRLALLALQLPQQIPENGTESLQAIYDALTDEQRVSIPVDLQQRLLSAQGKAKALFEWSDGSLVQAMKEGQFFLLDEISLADDSVLERLNSVLESQRSLLLAEKGVTDCFVQAADGFQFFATMNPGGDYGKRELSPALRNRFTEIWVPSLSELEDVLQIVEAKLASPWKSFAKAVVKFAEWFGQTYRSSTAQTISVRDVLAWVTFMNGCSLLRHEAALLHGASLVYIDTLGANPAALLAIDPENIQRERQRCVARLSDLTGINMAQVSSPRIQMSLSPTSLTIGEFSIQRNSDCAADTAFAFDAPTTKSNAMRVVRALQLNKPILLEGSPGVGKTTLVTALAKITGRPLTRINLSEQTDLMDLFGSDVPVEGADAGNFAWRDAPFLQAMQRGDWVLLDEMNLASQSVLEGLNACLDHRGEVYISELDQTFKRHPNFSVFAAQNPHHQGGGRKGLPSSFVNRFTVVYADVFRNDDLTMICKHNFPDFDESIMSNVISFVSALEKEVVYLRKFGAQGSPWEFNLRDTLRWLHLLTSKEPLLTAGGAADFLNLIFRQRFRSVNDRQEVDRLFVKVFGSPLPSRHLYHDCAMEAFQVGMGYLPRHHTLQKLQFPGSSTTDRLAELESMMLSVQQSAPCILVGQSGCGKSTLLETLAAAAGVELVVFPLSTDIDTMDLVGGYEQIDPQRASSAFLASLGDFLEARVLSSLPGAVPAEALELLGLCLQRDLSSSTFFNTVLQLLAAFRQKTPVSGLDGYLSQCQNLASTPHSIANARFEWVDGVLVKALEAGKWLVLDNANLCSSSVLDRLNSLLEPNGMLIINEHSGADGEPKIVKPHPDFRLFMTMDPRHGELSRAMRNRAVEIYFEPQTVVSSKLSTNFQLESQLHRYCYLVETFQECGVSAAQAALDNLSGNDIAVLARFKDALPYVASESTDCSGLARLIELKQSGLEGGILDQIGELYATAATASSFPLTFRNAQSLHPLQNTPLVPLLLTATGHDQAFWLGTVLEARNELLKAAEALTSQNSHAGTLKPSQMNRLQRSIVSRRVAAAAKDSTANAATFLDELLRQLDQYLRTTSTSTTPWKEHKKVLWTLLHLWWDTYALTTDTAFEEATFQAHLEISNEQLKKALGLPNIDSNTASGPYQLLLSVQQGISTSFDAGFKLSTGLEMEKLWLALRPLPISTLATLETVLALEEFASNFDAVRWQVSISVTELADIVASLLRSFQLVLMSDVDGNSLISTLREELAAVTSRVPADVRDIAPFFVDQFEALRQYAAIKAEHGTNYELGVLSNQPTKSLMKLATLTSSNHFAIAESLTFEEAPTRPILECFSAELLYKAQQMSEVDLQSLKLLESELPALGKYITRFSATLCASQIDSTNGLNSVLVLLIKQVLHFVSPDLAARFQIQLEHATSAEADDLVSIAASTPFAARIYETYLRESIVSIHEDDKPNPKSHKSTARAWVSFAMACIMLYVPDRAYDPDKRQGTERHRHEQLLRALNFDLTAIQSYEKLFTGQDWSLRTQILFDEIEELGEPAAALQRVYRPQPSELDLLQGEFNNLLNVVSRSEPLKLVGIEGAYAADSTTANDAYRSIELLQKNITQVVHRLTDRFRSYSDITRPAISILRCLQLGLSMALLTRPNHEHMPSKRSIQLLCTSTPFFAGSIESLDDGYAQDQYKHNTEGIAANGSGPSSKTIDADFSLEALSSIATRVAIEGPLDARTKLSNDFVEIIHSCYEEWIKRLEADRREAEANTGLYRYRGSAEDEEEVDQEQFNDLFPAFDEDSDPLDHSDHGQQSTRDTAVLVADLHSQVVVRELRPAEAILTQIRSSSRRIGHVFRQGMSFNQPMTKTLLPGALLAVDDSILGLTTGIASTSYNFYSDANLPESRKLVELISQIQARFRELQDIDEIAHMQPLEDVMVSCRELLRLRHTEPLAKIITKVEKVHGYMHEWQFGGWASKVNTAIELYDRLTQTIVSWRRLELSTWARLFDMENRKCDEDAKSWWFVAYQIVVAVPLGMADAIEELRDYAKKLLKELETYFSTAMQGQFEQRIKLLSQLQLHLDLLAADQMPNLSIISTAVKNFLDIYNYYKKTVAESLRNGRIVLEKTMKDVLLMASWKDTNIVALRDSAKRSHHKLFKLVRKYRALLGQPMDSILSHGLPDVSDLATVSDTAPTPRFPTVDMAALAYCADNVPQWTQKPKRFTNISQTIGLMHDAAQVSEGAVEGSVYIEDFLLNVISSTAELQKATPSVLTEENKVNVKHLKTRKRKLFADTIKELRQMGVKHNLAVDALQKQESLAIVLSSTPALPNSQQIDSHHYYHKSVDLVPRARDASRQYNEDLSGAEVIRSVGLLEGLLQIVIVQRTTLAAAYSELDLVESVISQTGHLWAPDVYDVIAGSIKQMVVKKQGTPSKLAGMLRWLPNVLRIAADLVKIHNKHSSIPTPAVEEVITNWTAKFDFLALQYSEIVTLPVNLLTSQHIMLVEQTNAAITSCVQEIQDLGTNPQYAGLKFILDHVPNWTSQSSIELASSTNKDIASLDAKVFKVCDASLAAIQNYKQAMAGLPTSTEDASWLIKEQRCLADSIRALQGAEISARIRECFELLSTLDLNDEVVRKSSTAIFAVALPIFQQYQSTLKQAIARYSALHRSTCKMTYVLAKSFIQIASQGFCTPSEKSEDQNDKNAQMEGGTGLGDGEGAEDISKDIQDDENLDELAQEPNKDEQGEIEDEQDAVDMADGEMEGQMGDAEEKDDDDAGSGDDDGEDDIDEEAGDVDDLDLNAKDEKTWDGDDEKAEKDQEGDESKGKQDKNEQAAADDKHKSADGDDGEEEDEEEDMAGAEQSEDVQQQDEIEKHDPHAKEEDALDLPDDLALDGDGEEQEESVASDDDMDDLSDVNEDGEDGENNLDEGEGDETKNEDAQGQEDQDMGDELDVVDLDKDEEEDPENPGEETQEAGEKADEEPDEQPEQQDTLLADQADDATADPDNNLTSDAQGTGEDQEEAQDNNDPSKTSSAQRNEGGKGGSSSEQREELPEDGDDGLQANGDRPQDQNAETQTSADAQPFKRLGDANEKWHRQQTKQQEAQAGKDNKEQQSTDVDANDTEFHHLQDEDAEADAQALGTATEDQAHALDESMAIDTEAQDMPDSFQPDEVENEDIKDDAMDIDDYKEPDSESTDAYAGRAGAMVQQSKHDRDVDEDESRRQQLHENEEDVEEVDSKLEATHIDDTTSLSMSRNADDARSLWAHYESLTRDLSLSLTEQLRLILAPTQATKMRGDFRTGKRLNIKRIIPYIASQYKRDKIWMRRSVPSKRSYQIMLAVDDSKSMGESGSGSLAFETLVMVSKSLSMLEVGEICVVGFGQDVRVAHEFDSPFSADAGPKIFQNFGFEQSRTDVTKLVRESIELFRTARAKASSSPADLWQLQLIISDGVCDSSEHDAIRRLLRTAVEERIMMVFIIVDDLKGKKQGESVMDMRKAAFVKNEMSGNSEVKIERYLDTFPFQYYLVVSDVKELPGVLAALLRQWFAEVADSS